MAKNDKNELTQEDSQEEIPQRVTKGDVKKYYYSNAVNYEQVAEHFGIEVEAVREVIEPKPEEA